MSDEKKGQDYLRLPVGRLDFPKFKEKRYNDSDVKKERGKYECSIIFPASADLAPLKKLIQSTCKAKWGDKAQALWSTGKIKSPMKLGAAVVNGDGERYAGYEEDSQVVSISFYNPLMFWDQFRNEIPSDSDQAKESFYAGCYVMAAVTAAAYDNESKGVQLRLHTMMKRAEGAPLGGSTGGNPGDVFADIPAEEATPVETNEESWED